MNNNRCLNSSEAEKECSKLLPYRTVGTKGVGAVVPLPKYFGRNRDENLVLQKTLITYSSPGFSDLPTALSSLLPTTIEFGWSLLMETSITLCMFVDGSFETFVQSGPTWILAQFYLQLVYKSHFGT